MKLYELTAQYQILTTFLETAEEDAEQFALALCQLKDAVEDKAENIGKLILNLQGDEEIIHTEMARLRKKANILSNRQASLKSYLLTELVAANIPQVKKPLFTISVRTSPPSVQIYDETLVPSWAWRVIPEQREPDKKGILTYWKTKNEVVPGTAILTDKKFLQIR